MAASKALMIYRQDSSMAKLAERVAKAYPEYFGHIELERVLFYNEITGIENDAAGTCTRLKPIIRQALRDAGVNANWIITFYSCHTDGKSDEWLTVLMFHELLHIGVDGKLARHDVEDFSRVLYLAGIDWSEDVGVPDIIRKKLKLIA